MLERRAVADRDLGDRIAEVRRVAGRDVALDHRRLRVPSDDHEIPRVHHRLRRGGVGDEQQMDRPRDLGIRRDLDDRAVVHERRVERRERAVLEARDGADLRRERRRGRPRAGEVEHRHAGRQRAARSTARA